MIHSAAPGFVLLSVLAVAAVLAWLCWPRKSGLPRYDKHGRENLVTYCRDCLQSNIQVADGMHVGCPVNNRTKAVKPVSPWVRPGAKI